MRQRTTRGRRTVAESPATLVTRKVRMRRKHQTAVWILLLEHHGRKRTPRPVIRQRDLEVLPGTVLGRPLADELTVPQVLFRLRPAGIGNPSRRRSRTLQMLDLRVGVLQFTLEPSTIRDFTILL